jgi:hypothetical protein
MNVVPHGHKAATLLDDSGFVAIPEAAKDLCSIGSDKRPPASAPSHAQSIL